MFNSIGIVRRFYTKYDYIARSIKFPHCAVGRLWGAFTILCAKLLFQILIFCKHINTIYVLKTDVTQSVIYFLILYQQSLSCRIMYVCIHV